MLPTLEVSEFCFHRNGISGKGFYVLNASGMVDDRYERMIITCDAEDVDAYRSKKPHDPATRVLIIAMSGGIDCQRTMRGDHFHEQCMKYIIKHTK